MKSSTLVLCFLTFEGDAGGIEDFDLDPSENPSL
jgi:hypothetical protein